MMETAILNIDEELQSYLLQLSVSQKNSVVALIKSFMNNKDEAKPVNLAERNNALKEAETTYQTGETMSDKKEPDETNSWIGKPETLEEYNIELEEAVAKIEAGEFFKHEEVVEKLNNRRWKK